jgi:hypothetical protein
MKKVILPRYGQLGTETVTLQTREVLLETESLIGLRARTLRSLLHKLCDCISPKGKIDIYGVEARQELAEMLISSCRGELNDIKREFQKAENIARLFIESAVIPGKSSEE